jgi:hypothetical protein
MNTAIARRLALGDRVIWMGEDDCQPRGLGTIIRITAHQVEVLWEGARARRYRRGQLHNLRHKKLISEAAEFRGTSQYGLERANYLGVSGAAPQANTISIST